MSGVRGQVSGVAVKLKRLGYGEGDGNAATSSCARLGFSRDQCLRVLAQSSEAFDKDQVS